MARKIFFASQCLRITIQQETSVFTCERGARASLASALHHVILQDHAKSRKYCVREKERKRKKEKLLRHVRLLLHHPHCRNCDISRRFRCRISNFRCQKKDGHQASSHKHYSAFALRVPPTAGGHNALSPPPAALPR